MRSAPQIKVCGIRSAGFARRAEELGVAYLGFIFAEGSPRRVSPDEAAEIVASLSGRAKRVGVFTSSSAEEIVAVAKRVPLDVVQLHSAAYGVSDVAKIRDAGFEVWLLNAEGADAVLLDGSDGERCGGTGRRADWERARKLAASGVRVVLAGGISSGNATAAAGTGCAVLDLNSSLETAPGVKSIQLLESFLHAFAMSAPEKLE